MRLLVQKSMYYLHLLFSNGNSILFKFRTKSTYPLLLCLKPFDGHILGTTAARNNKNRNNNGNNFNNSNNNCNNDNWHEAEKRRHKVSRLDNKIISR